jgi:hypothetical protein
MSDSPATSPTQDISEETRKRTWEIGDSEQPAKLAKLEEDMNTEDSEDDDDDKKQCPQCKQWKARLNFSKSTRNNNGLQSYCKACSATNVSARRRTRDGFMTTIYNSMLVRTRIWLKRGRFMEMNCTKDYLHELAESQGDVCAITGLPITFASNATSKASIDRIDDEVGYVMGNVRFVLQEFNGQGKWTKRNLYDMIDLAGQVTVDVEAELAPKAKEGSKESPRNWPIVNGKVFCHDCNTTKDRSAFTKQISQGCRDCLAATNKVYRETWHGVFTCLVNSSRQNNEKRNDPNRKAGCRELKHTLTYDEIVEIYRRQRGLCHVSDTPLSCRLNDIHRVSLERINNDIGYVKDNVVLVCKIFNVPANLTREKWRNIVVPHVQKIRALTVTLNE